MVKKASSVDAILNRFESIIIYLDVIILLFIVITVVCQVVVRYFNISLVGTEALAQYGYVLFVFFAWSVAALRGNDVSVRILFDRFPAKVRKILLVFFHICMAGFSALVFKSALINARNSALVTSPNLVWFKMPWLYYAVAVSVALTFIMNIIRAIRIAIGVDVYLTEKEINNQILSQAILENGKERIE